MTTSFINKKYELKDEKTALEFKQKVEALGFTSVVLGSGVVSQCYETEGLKKLEQEYKPFSFFPSLFDLSELETVISQENTVEQNTVETNSEVKSKTVSVEEKPKKARKPRAKKSTSTTKKADSKKEKTPKAKKEKTTKVKTTKAKTKKEKVSKTESKKADKKTKK